MDDYGCGIGEILYFKKMNEDGVCVSTPSQWQSWAFYLAMLFAVIMIFLAVDNVFNRTSNPLYDRNKSL